MKKKVSNKLGNEIAKIIEHMTVVQMMISTPKPKGGRDLGFWMSLYNEDIAKLEAIGIPYSAPYTKQDGTRY